MIPRPLLLALPVMACAAPAPPEPIPVPWLVPPKGAAAEAWFLAVADSLLALDAPGEARAATARGDCHLYGVMDYLLRVPGMQGIRADSFDIYLFPATSDDYTRDKYPAARWQYQGAAVRFARAYNPVVAQAPQCQRR
jgi:hypothetical protein